MIRVKMRWSLFLVVALMMALAAPIASADKVELKVGLATRESMELYEQVFKPAFEARHPNVEVTIEYISWTVDRYVVRYIGGTAPDVFQVGGDKLGAFTQMILPLDRYTQGWDVMDDMIPTLVNSARLDGQLLGLPWNYAVRQLTYRGDLFDEAGLDRDRPPTTWDEFVEIGRQLVRFDSSGRMTRQAYHTSNNMTQFSGWLFQAGGDWMSPDMTQAAFADEGGMEATWMYYRMFNEYRISDVNLGEMSGGEAAMQDTTPSAFANPNVSPYYGPEDVMVAEPLTHRRQAMNVMPSLWLVTDTTDHADLAWQWIDFMFEIENMVIAGESQSLIPTRNSLVRYSPWSDDPRWYTTLSNLQYGMTVTMASPHWDMMRRDFQQPALQRIMEGENPTIMLEAQRQANVWLQEQLRL